jgi:hypothetical protein
MMNNLPHAMKKFNVWSVNKLLSRNVGAVRGTGKKAPSVEEFNPIEPGDWQLAVCLSEGNLIHFLFNRNILERWQNSSASS